MPHPIDILVSIMSVTFIGQGTLPKNWPCTTFKVRRSAVWDTLVWLKINNLKYYGDIEIDDACLHALLEDNVFAEILVNIKQITDAKTFDQGALNMFYSTKKEYQIVCCYFIIVKVIGSNRFQIGGMEGQNGDAKADVLTDGRIEIGQIHAVCLKWRWTHWVQ